MVFSSHLFVFYFLPVALATYYLLPRRAQHFGLTLLSYLFYGWSNPAFVVLMFASTAIDYVCGLTIAGGIGGRGELARLEPGGARSRSQRLAVAVSIASNLALLGFFKYFNFGVDSWNALAAGLGWGDLRLDTVLRVALPLGISFYTFQSMSYTIDVYRGEARALRNFIDFACYVSMFPQLVAGPILRFSEIEAQLRERRGTLDKLARGAAFFSLGMAKKVLLANPCGLLADGVFNAGAALPLDAWLGMFAYSFQIYFDFSGYSDMAIGLGLMLGFVFPKNFDSPYRSRSITEFWRRWHVSLSTWLRDYLYLPLGGNRRGRLATYRNLALVMLLGGLWHGAAWTFVAWGALHGALLAWERGRGKRSLWSAMPAPVQRLATFVVVSLSWVFFRSPNFGRALEYFGWLGGSAQGWPGATLLGAVQREPYLLLTLGLAAVIAAWAPQTWDWTRRLGPVQVAASLTLFGLSLVALATQSYNPFIYFIF